MKVLLTGATGCVGSALADQLAGQGHEVVCLSRSPLPSADCQFLHTELSQPIDPSKLPAQIDAVFHLAQSRDFRQFPSKAAATFAINVATTQALLDYAIRAGAQYFCYASTGSVYRPAKQRVSEEAELNADNFYVASKRAAEIIAHPYNGLEGLQVFLPRLFYVYGPRQTGMLTNALAQRIRDGRPITLAGPEGIALAPTYSADVAAMLMQGLVQGWTGIMNLANPDIVGLKDYAHAIGQAIGQVPSFEVLDEAPRSVVPDVGLLASRYDFGRMTPLDQGLASMFATA